MKMNGHYLRLEESSLDAHYLKYPPDRGVREVYALDEQGVGYYAPHYHDHAEMMYVVNGCVSVNLDYKTFIFSEGDMLLLFPNQFHQFSEPYGRCHTYIFIFKPSVCANYSRILDTKRPEMPIIRNASAMPNVMNLMKLALKESTDGSIYSEQIVTGAMQALVGLLLRECTLVNKGNLDDNTAVRILNYCHAHYKEEISLSTAAKALNLSPYYLSHLIPQKYGMHFSELIATLRLDEAIRLIKDGQKISRAADLAGFPNIRSFNRAFQKQYNASPTNYLGLHAKRNEDGKDTL